MALPCLQLPSGPSACQGTSENYPGGGSCCCGSAGALCDGGSRTRTGPAGAGSAAARSRGGRRRCFTRSVAGCPSLSAGRAEEAQEGASQGNQGGCSPCGGATRLGRSGAEWRRWRSGAPVGARRRGKSCAGGVCCEEEEEEQGRGRSWTAWSSRRQGTARLWRRGTEESDAGSGDSWFPKSDGSEAGTARPARGKLHGSGAVQAASIAGRGRGQRGRGGGKGTERSCGSGR
mmetsp:Transcript_142005/g.453976  ORF Transcript_142005/g.453976 Transcript_142005/m.453976 type:complete len:232 (-) Transcript_142005:230-925(-)